MGWFVHLRPALVTSERGAMCSLQQIRRIPRHCNHTTRRQFHQWHLSAPSCPNPPAYGLPCRSTLVSWVGGVVVRRSPSTNLGTTVLCAAVSQSETEGDMQNRVEWNSAGRDYSDWKWASGLVCGVGGEVSNKGQTSCHLALLGSITDGYRL